VGTALDLKRASHSVMRHECDENPLPGGASAGGAGVGCGFREATPAAFRQPPLRGRGFFRAPEIAAGDSGSHFQVLFSSEQWGNF
jgi:hypothetical protein